ncbi:hypothetical protein KSF78_0005495 [Schistosoma japonicum]|nr:hypothetical protein KSF78_0005495 [Schistosoma japonicum]
MMKMEQSTLAQDC